MALVVPVGRAKKQKRFSFGPLNVRANLPATASAMWRSRAPLCPRHGARAPMPWSLSVMAVAGLLASAAPGAAAGASMWEFPMEVRRRNFVRVTREDCDDCATMEAFYEGNSLVFLLFYERALLGQNNYKGAIVAGFMETCQDLRWSRVACGIVDMIEDREYGERYIDPKTAPAHIVVRDGQPLLAQKHHVERLMKKPGDKASMLWHLRDLYTPEDPSALELVEEVSSVKAFKNLMSRHYVVIAIGVNSRSSSTAEAFSAAAQGIVLRGQFNVTVPGLHVPPIKPRGGSSSALRRARVVFAVVHGAGVRGKLEPALADGAVAAWVDGELQGNATEVSGKSKKSKAAKDLEMRFAKVILETARNALEAVKKRLGAADQGEL